MGWVIAMMMSIVLNDTAQASNIYTWEDSHGVVHFSDKPIKNAQTLTLPQIKTQTQAKQSAKKIETSSLPTAFVRFLTPIHEETIRDNNGSMVIQAIGNRPLTKPYSYQLYVDDIPYGQAQLKNKWQIANMDRGSHTLKLTLLKAKQVIATAPQITVYLHRARIKKAG